MEVVEVSASRGEDEGIGILRDVQVPDREAEKVLDVVQERGGGGEIDDY